MAQTVKNLPAMQETRVQSLGWEDPLEKGMATHSSILAWKIPWAKEPGRLQSVGSQRVRHNWAHTHPHTAGSARVVMLAIQIFSYSANFLSYLMAQMIKNLPATQETWFLSLDWEHPLKKGMAIHSSILAWEIPGTEEPGRLQSMGSQRVGHNLAIKANTYV